MANNTVTHNGCAQCDDIRGTRLPQGWDLYNSGCWSLTVCCFAVGKKHLNVLEDINTFQW